MEYKRTKTGVGKWGRRENVYFLASLLVKGVKKERGFKKTEEEVGELGAFPLAQTLINTRPLDRKWPGQLIAPGELPSGVEAVEEFSTQENGGAEIWSKPTCFLSKSSRLVSLLLWNANTEHVSLFLLFGWVGKRTTEFWHFIQGTHDYITWVHWQLILKKVSSWMSIKEYDVRNGKKNPLD